MLADAFFIWRCCRVAGIVFTVLSVQPSAFTAICFGRTVDTFKHDKLPPDHLSIIIKDRLVREFIILYKTFFSICDDLDITDAIPEMEEADGGIFLLEQLHSAIGEGEFIDKIQYEPHKRGDVLMLTGVGDVFPFMRVHSLLEALQPYFSDIPILVMYPGEFDGHYLKLFGRLTPNDYYRAFNIF